MLKTRMLRSRRGMIRSNIELSARGPAEEPAAGLPRSPGSFIFLESAHSHSNHLPESHYSSKYNPHHVQPVRMQPVVPKFTEQQAKQNACGNDEANLGIARERRKRLLLWRIVGPVSHAKEL